MARMAHDEAAFRQAFEETRKYRGEIHIRPVRIGAGEGRVGGDAEALGACAEFAAQPVDQQAFRIGQAAVQRQAAAALAHPGGRRDPARRSRARPGAPAGTDARADGRRRNPAGDRTHSRRLRTARGTRASAAATSRRCCSASRNVVATRKKRAFGERRVVPGQRLERPGQREMQADRDALLAGIERGKRMRLGAREARRQHHHGGGVEAARAPRGRGSPRSRRARCRSRPRRARSAGVQQRPLAHQNYSAAVRGRLEASAALTVCSATK